MAAPLVLASSSPRRVDLLAQAGINFEVIAPDVKERADAGLTLCELTTWNALRKGMSVARGRPERVVLAADTLVALNGRVIGKPADQSEAIQFLQELSGQVHQVCSSVFVGRFSQRNIRVIREVSHVRFKRLSPAVIRDYVARVNPLDKAGAYAAQGRGAEIIERIEGSFSNVVGLPMEQTLPLLGDFGIRPS